MAGSQVVISNFLKTKYEESIKRNGEGSVLANVLRKQYMKDSKEEEFSTFENLKHYEAHLDAKYKGISIPYVERLQKSVILIQPTNQCATNCRYCLRKNYPKTTLNESEIIHFAKMCGSDNFNNELSEVLITGGDPLLVPDSLELLISSLIDYAPNIKVIRIGSRLPLHDPGRINKKLIQILRKKEKVRIELSTQINHTEELFSEVKEAFLLLQMSGVTIYNQTVLLNGVNDDIGTLSSLFENIRILGIENHYLFHAIPLAGTEHLRTPLDKGVELLNYLINRGELSSRSFPKYCAMTDIGKIIITEGVIRERRKNLVLLQSYMSSQERKKWNPNWEIPSSANVDENEYLQVWYRDKRN